MEDGDARQTALYEHDVVMSFHYATCDDMKICLPRPLHVTLRRSASLSLSLFSLPLSLSRPTCISCLYLSFHILQASQVTINREHLTACYLYDIIAVCPFISLYSCFFQRK